MLEDVLAPVRRRLVTAVVVGLLAFGAPPPRPMPLRLPPALVRVQTQPSPGALAWHEFFGPLRAELN
jgi:hypothetical protein